MTRLDIELERCGWLKADTLWHVATDALLARDYATFDRTMREINAILKFQRGSGASAQAAPNDK